MRPDEIIEEIRKRREEFAAPFEFDARRIADELQRQQKESGRTLISRPARKPDEHRAASSTTNRV